MAIREGLVQYPSGGLNMHGFLARPACEAPAPGVLVIQEWWGLNDHIRNIAKRLAQAGYVALAPDLYSRLGHPVAADAAEAAQLMQSLKEADALKDVQASLTYLGALKEVDRTRLGVVGFCMGGSFALRIAVEGSPNLKAAVPFYGQVPPTEELRRLHCPVLYLYGGQDHWIKRSDVERLREALQGAPSTSAVHIYEQAGHAFFNDTRPDAYDAPSARDAWQKTLAFLQANFR